MPTALAYQAAAHEVMDRHLWDFVEGGAGDERAVLANVHAFDAVRLRPRVLTGCGEPSTKTRILGRHWRTPIAVAPMAYHTAFDDGGEVSTASGADRAGCPLVVSTFAGRRFADIAAATTIAPWLQLYCFKDRSVTRHVIETAEAAGFEVLVLTVDTPRLGRRLRDERNGFRLPDGVLPANLPPGDFSSPSEHSRTAFDPGLDWTVLDWLRSITALPVLVKGVLAAEDAELAIKAGAAGVIVSNHGGRQLDRAPATLDVLAEIAAAVDGRCPVLLDGGVRRGSDVLAAAALGADAVLIGRPVLHALAAEGSEGVARLLVAVAEELADTMVLTGTASLSDARPELVIGRRQPTVEL
ncbi:alpha-hydroxy acid oxidase [Streptomyces hyaluromycini]|uniref:Alpha-hydroxy acid oxidase n=1 Tax=Streptomyces hyaluromycini TaxID=1377993 RepID=A0ABV1WMW5_9ACTN